MFPICSTFPRSANPVDQTLFAKKQKVALISDIACIAIFAALATLIILSTKGVPLHAFNALGTLGLKGGIGFAALGGTVLITDIVTLYVLLAKRIMQLRNPQPSHPIDPPPPQKNDALEEAETAKVALERDINLLKGQIALLPKQPSPDEKNALETQQKLTEFTTRIQELEKQKEDLDKIIQELEQATETQKLNDLKETIEEEKKTPIPVVVLHPSPHETTSTTTGHNDSLKQESDEPPSFDIPIPPPFPPQKNNDPLSVAVNPPVIPSLGKLMQDENSSSRRALKPAGAPSLPSKIAQTFHTKIGSFNPRTRSDTKQSVLAFLEYLERKASIAEEQLKKAKEEEANLTSSLTEQLEKIPVSYDCVETIEPSDLMFTSMIEHVEEENYLTDYFKELTLYVKKDADPEKMQARILECTQKIQNELLSVLQQHSLQATHERHKSELLLKETLEAERLKNLKDPNEEKQQKVEAACLFAPYDNEQYLLKNLSFSSLTSVKQNQISRENITPTFQEASKSLEKVLAFMKNPLDQIDIGQLEKEAGTVKDFLRAIHARQKHLKIELKDLFSSKQEQ